MEDNSSILKSKCLEIYDKVTSDPCDKYLRKHRKCLNLLEKKKIILLVVIFLISILNVRIGV